jgi:hypothetical protein
MSMHCHTILLLLRFSDTCVKIPDEGSYAETRRSWLGVKYMTVELCYQSFYTNWCTSFFFK